jgi:hypothetical protein
MIMTDSTVVKLTVREAANKANAGRAILLWQVIDQFSRSDGDAAGIDGLDATSGMVSPGHTPASAPDPIDGDTLAQYV